MRSHPSLQAPWASVQHVLAIRMDNVGDVVMTGPALRAIKENLPQVQLTLLASPGGAKAAPLLPWIDSVIPWRALWQDLGQLDFNPAREWQLVSLLRKQCFDAAIIFTSFSQSPHPPGFICFLADIPLRLGSSQEQDILALTTPVPAAPTEIHQVERNLRLLEAVGFYVGDRSLTVQISASDDQAVVDHLKAQGIAANDPFLLLNPWTSCQARTYDTKRFAKAASYLARLTGWPVVITGEEKDRERSSVLLDTLGPLGIDLIGKTSFPELAALVAKAKLVLTNNTSVMHLADATRTPSVVLFAGTEHESQWQPRHSSSSLLRRPTPCSPCYAFTCPYHLECLDIPAARVVITGLELLQKKIS